MTREIRLNAFDMNCVVHQSAGLWRHPRDRSDEYNRLDYWIEVAEILERGKFDALFIADVLGVYDVYGGNVDAALEEATQIPLNDPVLLIPPMARATKHLGFGVTCTLSFEPPYTFARRMSTLDHLTEGRIGWNIVTGYLNSAAKGVGLDHIAANLEEGGVNVFDNVRPAQNQQFVTTFFTPEIVHTGIAELDIGPHRAVVDNDAFLHGLEKVRH